MTSRMHMRRLSRADRRAWTNGATAYRNRYVQLASLAERGTLTRRREPEHVTTVSGSDAVCWWATCTCSWHSTTVTRESVAKGLATKHRNRASAAAA
jgi:hypothetical protein